MAHMQGRTRRVTFRKKVIISKNSWCPRSRQCVRYHLWTMTISRDGCTLRSHYQRLDIQGDANNGMEVGDLETECWSKEHKSHSGEHVLELASAIDHSNLQFSLPMTTCSLAKFTKQLGIKLRLCCAINTPSFPSFAEEFLSGLTPLMPHICLALAWNTTDQLPTAYYPLVDAVFLDRASLCLGEL